MIRDLLQSSPDAEHRSEICVVGAGAAGIALAILLSRAGKQVTLLEGGGQAPGSSGAIIRRRSSGPGCCCVLPSAVNPGTMVLFSTRTPARILQNVIAAQDAMLTTSAMHLHELLRHRSDADDANYQWSTGDICRSGPEVSCKGDMAPRPIQKSLTEKLYYRSTPSQSETCL